MRPVESLHTVLTEKTGIHREVLHNLCIFNLPVLVFVFVFKEPIIFRSLEHHSLISPSCQRKPVERSCSHTWQPAWLARFLASFFAAAACTASAWILRRIKMQSMRTVFPTPLDCLRFHNFNIIKKYFVLAISVWDGWNRPMIHLPLSSPSLPFLEASSSGTSKDIPQESNREAKH